MLKGITFGKDEKLSDEEKRMVNGKFEMASASSKKKAADNGGIKEIKATKTALDETDPSKAYVDLDIVFNNGTVEKDHATLIKIEDEWKILVK